MARVWAEASQVTAKFGEELASQNACDGRFVKLGDALQAQRVKEGLRELASWKGKCAWSQSCGFLGAPHRRHEVASQHWDSHGVDDGRIDCDTWRS